MAQPNNSLPNPRDRLRWFPIFNVCPKRTIPSFGISQFAHVLPPTSWKMLLEQYETNPPDPASAISQPFEDEFGMTHIPHEVYHGTSEYEGQGIFRVHQCSLQAPFGGLNGTSRFWDQGAQPEFTPQNDSGALYLIDPSPAHFWFNSEVPCLPLTPGCATRDFPCLALAMHRYIQNGQNFDPFIPGDRLTFDKNSFWLRRFNYVDINAAGNAADDSDQNDSTRPSFRVLATELAERNGRSYGVKEYTFSLVWVEPWVGKGWVSFGEVSDNP